MTEFPPEDPLEREIRERRALARVRRRLRWGTVATVVAVVGLAVGTDLSSWHVLGLPAFFIFLPALALAQLPVLDIEPMRRLPVYLGSIVTILTLGLVGSFLSGRVEGASPADFSALPTGELLVWTAGLTLAGLGIILVSRPVERAVGGGRTDLLRELLPRTRRERGVFAALSFAAGIGEELAYRAYAFRVIQLLGPGPWMAAALASIPFGALHAYQGPVGVVRTALMGLVLAAPVVLTGSLLPSIAAHTLIDLLVGMVLGPRLLDGAPDSGDLVHRDSGQ